MLAAAGPRWGRVGLRGGRGPARQVQLQPWDSRGTYVLDMEERMGCISDTMLDPSLRAAAIIRQGEILQQSPKILPCVPLCQLNLGQRGRKRELLGWLRLGPGSLLLVPLTVL